MDELEALGIHAIGLFTESLRAHGSIDNVNGQAVDRFPTALTFLLDKVTGKCLVDVLISSMAFAMGEVNPDGPTLGNWSADAVKALNVPVLQAINSVGTYAEWKESARGLNPLDTAMNVAIPEFDGRIITLPISFMAPVHDDNQGDNAQYYEPVQDRVAQVAKQANRLARLRHKPNEEKRIAFMLTNSSGKAERIGDAVGLDTPASIIKVFEAMKDVGYQFGDDFPTDGDTLIQNLVDRCSYDEIYLTESQLANAAGHVPKEVYNRLFDHLPKKQKDHMVEQWGKPPGEAYVHDDAIALAGLEFEKTTATTTTTTTAAAAAGEGGPNSNTRTNIMTSKTPPPPLAPVPVAKRNNTTKKSNNPSATTPTSTASTTNMTKSSTNTTIITTIGSSGARLPNPNNNNNNPTNNTAIPNSNNARFFNIYEYLAGADTKEPLRKFYPMERTMPFWALLGLTVYVEQWREDGGYGNLRESVHWAPV